MNSGVFPCIMGATDSLSCTWVWRVLFMIDIGLAKILFLPTFSQNRPKYVSTKVGHVCWTICGTALVHLQNNHCLLCHIFAKDGPYLFCDIWAKCSINYMGQFRFTSLFSGPEECLRCQIIAWTGFCYEFVMNWLANFSSSDWLKKSLFLGYVAVALSFFISLLLLSGLVTSTRGCISQWPHRVLCCPSSTPF